MKNKVRNYLNIESLFFISVIFFVSLALLSGNNFLRVQNSITSLENSPSISITLGEETKYYETLLEAINASLDNELTTIVLHDNVELNTNIKILNNKNIVIDGQNKYSVIRGKSTTGDWYNGTLFTIAATGNLHLKNVIVDLGNNWSFNQVSYDEALNKKIKVASASEFVTSELGGSSATATVFTNNGTLLIENSIIKNHYSNSSSLFTANTGSTTKLIGSTIMHNASLTNNVIVYTTGAGTTFYVEEGTSINDNFAGSNGGIFKIYNNSQVIFNGGEVRNNKSLNTNGVVAMMYGCTSTLTMNGGTFANNSGAIGNQNGRNGMIYLHSCGRFVMNAGVIENNKGTSAGGIDAARSNSSIELNGGIIQNNEVAHGYNERSDVALSYDYNLTIGKNMTINGNVVSAGAIVNEGKINGRLTLNMGASEETNVLSGAGVLEGDVIVSYTKEEEPEYEITSTVIGNKLPINKTKEYIATYYYNGGKDELGLTNYRLIAVEGDSKPDIPTPTKIGHSVYWYSDPELTTVWEHQSVTEDISVYAKWIPNSYVVTWQNGHETIVQKVTYGVAINLPQTPSKTGYTFNGWSNYVYGMTMPDKDLVFVANWKINNYTVTFNTNGGSTINPITQNYNTIISKPNDPTALCKKFVGWYVDKDLTKEYDFNSRLTQNITLYAKWEDDHKYGAWHEFNEEEHFRVCERDLSHREYDGHIGGQATISKKATCELCGAQYGQLLDAKTFKVTSGENEKYYKYSFNKVKFKTTGNIEKFDYIKINGNIVEKRYYEIKEDYIILNNDYLDEFNESSNEIEFYYFDGIAKTTLNIKNNYFIISILIILVLIIIIFYLYKKNSNGKKRVLRNRKIVYRPKKKIKTKKRNSKK